MKNQDTKTYETPLLTVVSFKTERGYAASVLDNLLLEFSYADDADQVEQYDSYNDWGGGRSFWD